MHKPFDSTTKDLVASEPGTWLHFIDPRIVGDLTVIDCDLSTITTGADKVIRVDDPRGAYIVHLEFQSGYEPMFAPRLLRYNALLSHRHRMPVQSAVVLLRPEADGPDMTGSFRQEIPGGQVVHEFRFLVVRVWKTPVASLLAGGLGTLPLAPISDLAGMTTREVLRQMAARLEREADAEQASRLWTSTYFLMGLRFTAEQTEQLFQGVGTMKESATFQATVAEGEKRALLSLGRKRFGPPGESVVAIIDSIVQPAQVEGLLDRVLEASSWAELLGSSTGQAARS